MKITRRIYARGARMGLDQSEVNDIMREEQPVPMSSYPLVPPPVDDFRPHTLDGTPVDFGPDPF